MAIYPPKQRPASTFGLNPPATVAPASGFDVAPRASESTNPLAPTSVTTAALAPGAKPAAPAAPATATAPAPAAPAPAATPSATQSPVARYLGSDFRSLGLAPAPAATMTKNPAAPIIDTFSPRPVMPPPILDPSHGPRDTSVEGLDGLQRDTAWVLPKGQVVGYGGKLDHDVNDIYRTEYGREADAAARDRHRAGLARGQMTPEQIRAELDATHEGQEFNLQHDPLDDAGFSRRLYSSLFGQEADEAERVRLTSMLAQGREREDLLKELMESEAFKKTGRKVDQAAIDKVFGQGDTFKGELKNDDVEKQLAENFKRELGRAPTQRELEKYAEMVRSGKVKTEATDLTTPEQAAQTFYQTLFRGHPHGYQPSADEVQVIKGILAGPADQVTTRLRHLAENRRRGADYVSWGANTSADDVLNAVSKLRHGNTKSQLLEMLRARKAAGFADGGRVELQEDGTLKKINAKKIPSRPGDEKVRHPKDKTAGIRGRREDEEPDIFLNRGGRVKRAPITIEHGYADGGRAGSDETLRQLLRDYLVRINPEQNRGDGGSGANADLSLFDNMSTAEMLRWAKGQQDPRATGLNRMGEFAIGDDDPLVAQFMQQHGARDWGDVEAPDSGNRRARGFVMGYGDPTYGRERIDGNTILADGSRILRLPDGRYIREEANINTDEVAGQQRSDETQWRQNAQEIGRVIAAPIAMAAGQYAGFIPAGDMSGVMAAGPGQGFGTAGGLSSGSALGATGAAVQPDIYANAPPAGGTGAPTVDVGANLALNTTAPPPALLDAMPAIQQASGGAVSTWQQALAWVQSNPVGAARLGLTVAGLVGGGASAGGGESPGSGPRPQYTPGAGNTGPGSGPPPGGGYTIGAGNTGVKPPTGKRLDVGEPIIEGKPPIFADPDIATDNPVGRAPRASGLPVADVGNPLVRGDGPAVARPASSNPILDAYRASGEPAVAPATASPNIYMGGGMGGGGGSSLRDSPSAGTADANDPINELLGVGHEQIERYRRYDPIERQVIEEARRAGNAASQEEQAALAGEDVAGQFDRERGMLRRRLRADPSRAAALGLQLDVGEGGSKAYAMNAARRAERDSGFGKRMAALGLGDNALKTGLGAVSGGVSALLNKEQLRNQRDATAASTSVAMSGINARMAEAEEARRLDRERMALHGSQFDRTFSEGTRRYDQGFTEDRRRSDRGYDRGVYESDRGHDRGVYRDDRDFDFSVWRTNNGLDIAADERDYTRGRQRWQDVGSGVRTGLDLWDRYNWGDWQLKDGGKVRAKVRARGLTGYASGGRIMPSSHHGANGGEVKGPGDGTVDTVPAMLADGEMVLNAEATAYLDKVVPGLLEKANQKGLAIRKMRSSRAALRGLEV